VSIIAQHGNADMQHLRSLGRRRLIDFLDKDTRHALFIEAFDARLARHERDAVRIYYEACALAGIERQTQIAQQILVSIGAASEDDARRKMAIVQEAELLAESPADEVAALADRISELAAADPALLLVAESRLARLGAVRALPPHINGHAT